jgi:DNA-binding NarL/FixJ family response regulator
MIVDDNARARSALAAYFSGLPEWQVYGEAFDGQDALDQLRSRAPDVVLMDCRMPRMTGPEATRLLKRRWPRLKVVILSVYPECRLDAEQAGADAFLIKGCSPEEMLSTLLSVVAE